MESFGLAAQAGYQQTKRGNHEMSISGVGRDDCIFTLQFGNIAGSGWMADFPKLHFGVWELSFTPNAPLTSLR